MPLAKKENLNRNYERISLYARYPQSSCISSTWEVNKNASGEGVSVNPQLNASCRKLLGLTVGLRLTIISRGCLIIK